MAYDSDAYNRQQQRMILEQQERSRAQQAVERENRMNRERIAAGQQRLKDIGTQTQETLRRLNAQRQDFSGGGSSFSVDEAERDRRGVRVILWGFGIVILLLMTVTFVSVGITQMQESAKAKQRQEEAAAERAMLKTPDEVRDFVRQHQQRLMGSDLDAIMADYGSSANFQGKMRMLAELRRDRMEWMKAWPTRTMKIRGNIDVQCATFSGYTACADVRFAWESTFVSREGRTVKAMHNDVWNVVFLNGGRTIIGSETSR